jgi:hypothetical protein
MPDGNRMRRLNKPVSTRSLLHAVRDALRDAPRNTR